MRRVPFIVPVAGDVESQALAGKPVELAPWRENVMREARDSLVVELVQALAVMVDHARERYPHFESPRGQRDLAQAEAALERAERELGRKPFIQNPALVIYGNPLAVHGPAKIIGQAEELRYGWQGEWYKHPFDSDVEVLGSRDSGGRRTIVLVGVQGQPLWASQAEVDRGEVVA